MSNPVPGDVHVNTPLTQISIAFLQSATSFIAAKVFPNIPVKKQSDRYYIYDRGDFNRDEMQKRAPGTESAGGGYTLDNTPTYFCDVWAFHKDIPDQVRSNEDSVLSSDRDASIYVSRKGLIKREVLWASNYFASSVWDTDITPANLWDTDSGTPIEDVRLGKRTVLEATGFIPNTMVLGRPTYDALVDHPDIVDRIKYGQTPGNPAQAGVVALSKLFEIPRVFVMDAIRNTAAEGQSASPSFIGGKHALLCYSTPSPGLMTPTAGYTFSWTGFMGAGAEGNRIKKFRIEREESDRVEIQMAFDLKVVASDLGYFFASVVS